MTTNCNCNTAREEGVQQVTAERLPEGITFTPRVDILETDKELILLADLPGVSNEDVELRFEKGQLVLSGHVKPRLGEKQSVLREYGEGDFYRTFALADSIDATKIEANCKQGILTVHLPKVEAVKPRQITVNAH
jgi:HSP20 family protein